MDLITAMQHRYAVKAMTGEKVAQEKVEIILEAARLAPTSSGLQPFKIVVVSNPELKKQLRTVSYGQRQIEECSHLLVFASWDQYTVERVSDIIDYHEQVRDMPADGLEEFKQQLLGKFPGMTAEQSFQHSSRQACIGFGLAVAQAALLEVDASVMEGFEQDKYDELLGLPAQGFKSIYVIALGVKDTKEDWLYPMKKVRRPMSEFVERRD